MDLIALLQSQSEVVVDEATEALDRAALRHYREGGPGAARTRLADLFDLVVTCLRTSDLAPIVAHAERIGRERFEAGFDLFEIQTAFNVLEEAIWRLVVAKVPPDELGRALGLVGTVLGAGKDEVARSYVAMASRLSAPSMDLRALFKGPRI